MLIPTGLLNELQAYGGRLAGVAQAALEGDVDAEEALTDLMEEEDMLRTPFEVGKQYLIQTVTLYYVGRVVEVGFGWIRLERASWIHWTGRLSTLVARKNFSPKGWPAGQQTPRTEYVGEVVLWPGNHAVASIPWTGELPESSIP